MSIRSTQRLLWLVFLVTLPLPFMGLQVGIAPAVRPLFIGAFTGLIVLGDPDVLSSLVAGLLLLQGIVWSAVLYFVSRFVSRFAARGAPDGTAAPAERVSVWPIVAIAAACILVSLFPVYWLPFSSSGPSSNLFGIFD